MTALATSPTSIRVHATAKPAPVIFESTEVLMHELLQLRDTSKPSPRHMLDALQARGLGRLVTVLERRNMRLRRAAAGQSPRCAAAASSSSMTRRP